MQQKICKKDLKDLLKSEPDFEKVVSTVKNEGQAQKITAQTRSSQADVILFSGCKDNQTSQDTKIFGYGRTGAISYAFIDAVRENQNINYERKVSWKIFSKNSNVYRFSNRHEHSFHFLILPQWKNSTCKPSRQI